MKNSTLLKNIFPQLLLLLFLSAAWYCLQGQTPNAMPGANTVLPDTNKHKYARVRFSASAGYGYRLARIPDNLTSEEKNYMKHLKGGFAYEASLSYFFSARFGFGINYQGFQTRYADNGYIAYEDGTVLTGIVEDKIRIDYVGPHFSIRFESYSEKNAVLFDISIGYVFYTDHARVLTEQLLIKGKAFAGGVSIGYDLGLSKRIALGIKASAILGTIRNFSLSYGGRTQPILAVEPENISYIALSLGLRLLR